MASTNYRRKKAALQASEAARPKDPGESPGENAPGFAEWQCAKAAWALSSFRNFVHSNGRIYDYYAPLHDRICDKFEACLPRIGEQQVQKRFLRMYPRHTFKTTLLEELITYAILKWPKIRILILRATKELAADVLFEVRNESLVTPFVRAVWGNVEAETTKDSQYEFSVTGNKDPTIRCSGLEGTLTGTHIDLALPDDIVTDENYASKTLARQIRSRMANLRPILHPKHGNIMLTGTYWPKPTYYDQVVKESERLRKSIKEALEAGDKKRAEQLNHKTWDIDIAGVHNADGTLLFPTVIDENFLRLVREDPDEGQFYAGWYEMVSAGELEKPFPKEQRRWFRGQLFHDPIPHIQLTNEAGHVTEEVPVNVYTIIDPTLTAATHSDFCGITILGVDAKGRWWVFSSRQYKELPSTMADVVALQLVVFKPSYLAFEPGALSAQMVAAIQRAIAENDLPTSIVDLKLSKKRGAKEKRINGLQIAYKKGDILLQEGPWCRDLAEQMDEWTGIGEEVDHEDVLDSLSMAGGFVRPCAHTSLEELDRSDDPFDPNWTDPGVMDWRINPWQNVTVSPHAGESFRSRVEEAGKLSVNVGEWYPQERESRSRIGGHAGRRGVSREE